MKKTLFLLIFIVFFCFLGTVPLFSQGSNKIDSLVSNIHVQFLENTALKLTWIKPKNKAIQEIAIYKSNKNMSLADIYTENAIAIVKSETESFIDEAFLTEILKENSEKKAVFYYLLSIDSSKTEDAKIIPLLIPGTNFQSYLYQSNTTKPVNGTQNQVESKQILQNTNDRSIYPLPRKNIEEEKIENESVLSKTQYLESIQKQAEKKLLINKTQIFDEDLEAKAGEAYLLAEILKKQLVYGNFKETEDAIRSFLMIHRSQETRYKSIFYLAQALYFQEQYVEALFYFIECQNYLFDVSRDWIDACLHILNE